MNKLIVIRGLPGSGKSTLAKWMAMNSYTYHLEADMFFMKGDGTYDFQPALLGQAHEWCRTAAEAHLINGDNVIVSNTFTTRKEIMPYSEIAMRLGVEFTVITVEGDYGSVHAVPVDTLRRMKARWEDWDV